MFTWKEEYSVGIDSIDQQHKHLFEMGQSMSDLVSNHQDEDIYDELTAMFNELIDYTRYHFESEEQLMAQVNYEDIEDHKIQHHLFVEKLESYDLETIDEDQSAFALKLLKTIATWIFKHITGDDFKYRKVMKVLN